MTIECPQSVHSIVCCQKFQKNRPIFFQKIAPVCLFQRQKQRHLKLLYRLYAVKFAGLIR